MSRTSRIIQPIFLLLIIWFMLAGCRGGNNEAENKNGTGQPADTTLIRFADAGFKEALYRPLMEAFAAENPGLQIEYVPVEEANNHQTGELDLFTLASLADTMILPRRVAAEEGNYFQDVGGRVNESDYWPGALAACRAGEAQAAVPLFVTPTLVFVHGELFDAVGLDRPEPGWSWDDFAAAAGAIGAADGVYGFAQGESPAGLFGPTIDRLLPTDRSGLDPAALTAATGWYADLAAQGAILLPDEAPDAAQLITAGQVAMWLDSPANLPAMRNQLGDDLIVLPYPADEIAAESTPVSASCAAISIGTAQPDMAWAWLDFLAQNPFVGRRGEIPGGVTIADSSGFWANIDDETAATYRYALEHAWYAGVDSAIQIVGAALGNTLATGGDAETEISEIESLPTPTPVPTAGAAPVVENTQPLEIIEGAEGLIRFFNGAFATNMTTMRDVAEEFAALTGRQVQFNDFFTAGGVPDGTPIDSIFATLASNHDCMLWRGSLPSLLQTQVIPIEEMLQEHYPDLLADFAPQTLAQARQDGVLYGLPLVLEPQTLFVNQDRFERKNIPLPDVGWTTAEFEAVAEQMPLGEGRGQIYGYVPLGEFNLDAYEPLLAIYGAMPFDLGASPPAVYFDDPATIAALEQIQSLIEAGIVAPFEGGGTRGTQGNANEMSQIIQSGRGTIWNENFNAAFDRFGFSGTPFILQPIPYPVSDVPLPAPNMTRLFIFAGATNPEACLDWIATLSNHPEITAGIPARISWRESEVWAATVGEESAAALRDTVGRSTKMPADDVLYFVVYKWWEDALAEIWAGADKATELGNTQAKAEAYFACIASADLSLEAVSESVRSCTRQVDPEFPFPEI